MGSTSRNQCYMRYATEHHNYEYSACPPHIEEWMLLVSYQDVIIESSCSLPLLYKLVSHWVVHCGFPRSHQCCITWRPQMGLGQQFSATRTESGTRACAHELR